MPAQKLALLSAAIILTACATPQENPHYQHSTKYKGNPLNSPYGASNPVGTQVAHGYSTTDQYASTGTVLNRVVVPETSQAAQDTRQVIYEQSSQDSSYASAAYGTTTYNEPAYSRVAPVCIEQGLQNTPGCTPTSLPINTQSASVAQPYSAGAQTLYVTNSSTTPLSPTEQAMPESYGTPGYEAIRNSQAAPQWEAAETTQPLGVAVPVTQPFASPLPAPAVRPAQIQDARSPTIMQNQQSFNIGTQREIREGDTVYSFSRQLCTSVDEIKAINSLDGTFNIRLGDTIRLPASQC